MKAQRLYTVLFCTLLLYAMSCVKEEPGIVMEEDGLVRVPVGLNLSVEAMVDGTPETKGRIMEPEEDATALDGADQISNILVLQFNGITSEARLVGGQSYFDHWPLHGYNPSDPLYDVNDKLTLVASASANTVVVLANTFGEVTVTNNTTLGQFLLQDYTTIGTLSGVLTTSGGDDYFRLSGSQKLDNVSGVTNVSIALKRNVAKIVVKVKNASANATPPVTISKVQLQTINAKYYYLAHIAPELTTADPTLTFKDTYTSAYPCRIDNDQEDFPAANNLGGEEATAVTYTYYVPANLRGTTSNTQQYSKSLGSPDGATRFCIYGTYGTSNTPINYTYYLGENFTNDFNIKPNCKYTYNITINSKGNSNYDYRIEDLGEVKFTADANCYMLHPPTVSGQSRVYAIPVRRAAVFWNEPGHSSGVGVYGARKLKVNDVDIDTYQNNQLLQDSQWDAEVLWSDFHMTAAEVAEFLHVNTGNGCDPTNPLHNQAYFKVKVKSGMKGNVVVGIKKHGGSAILWSWHLWITDYNPDKYVVPLPSQYVYGVENGEIHRYNNATWEAGGLYENGFIMDRNLGANDTKPSSSSAYGMFYEFGRKDPFNATAYFYLGGTGDAVEVNADVRKISYNATGVPGNQNIRYSVENPMNYIANGSGTWTSSSDNVGYQGGSSVFLWNDPKLDGHTGDAEIWEARKSFYDPCPYGWKVPINGTWSDYSISSTNPTEYTVNYEKNGFYYYPEGYLSSSASSSIYYPASGFRSTFGGVLNQQGTYGYSWSATRITLGADYTMFCNGSYMQPERTESDTMGLPIRCVRE